MQDALSNFYGRTVVVYYEVSYAYGFAVENVNECTLGWAGQARPILIITYK